MSAQADGLGSEGPETSFTDMTRRERETWGLVPMVEAVTSLIPTALGQSSGPGLRWRVTKALSLFPLSGKITE